jgi:hypothetical protein
MARSWPDDLPGPNSDGLPDHAAVEQFEFDGRCHSHGFAILTAGVSLPHAAAPAKELYRPLAANFPPDLETRADNSHHRGNFERPPPHIQLGYLGRALSKSWSVMAQRSSTRDLPRLLMPHWMALFASFPQQLPSCSG